MPNTSSYIHYEHTASEYDRARFEGVSGRWNSWLQRRILYSIAKNWNTKKILEIGCGTGRCTKMLLNRGFNVTAIDPSISMLMEAKKRCKKDNDSGKVYFINSDIESLSCLRDKYDVIILVNVFSRLPDVDHALQKITGALSDDGELVFNFQCLTSLLLPFAIIVNRKNKSLSNNVFSCWYRPSQIKMLLRKHKFKAIAWYGHHYVPVPRLLFWTLPAMWIANVIISNCFPKISPSLFVQSLKINQIVSTIKK